MAGKVDKRTSNFIIAGGYCLVAVIILINYLGQPSLRIRGTAPVKPATTETGPVGVVTGPDNIHRQLEEQKRVNQEMREMLRRLQEGYKGRKMPGAKATASTSDNDLEIPELDESVLKSLMTKQANPFVKGRNPFMPSRHERSGLTSEVSAAAARPLKVDANLPFIISGANSSARFIANY